VIILLSLTAFMLLAVVAIGYPVFRIITKVTNLEFNYSIVTKLTLVLIIGFGLTTLSTSVAYGATGIDSFPWVIVALIVTLNLVNLLYRTKIEKTRFTNTDLRNLAILGPITYAIFLARAQWSSLTSPVIHAGNGPDVSQNLMAALTARGLGSTWAQQGNQLKEFLGTDSLRESVYALFTLPSFRDQAGFDYLVFGTRWSLTVLYSQVLRFFGDGAILWETGFVLLFSLITTAIISYGIISVFSNRSIVRSVGSLICVGNAGFLFQFFNGGLSQAFATMGILGIFLSLTLLIKAEGKDPSLNKVVFILNVFSWTILLTTYIDAGIILACFLLLFIFLLFIFKRDLLRPIAKTFILSGFLALLINPFLTYSTISIFDLRAKSASNTGVNGAIWALPSELFGIGADFVSQTSDRSIFSAIFGVLMSLAILLIAISYMKISAHALIIVSASAVLLLAFVTSVQSSDSNYIYHKVGVYFASGVIISLIFVLESIYDSRLKNRLQLSKFIPALLVVILSSSVVGAVSVSNKLSTQGSTISNEMKELIGNKELQTRLSQYNFLTPYVLSANYLGVLGEIYWISKSPNDVNLETRMTRELRLICYLGDPNCKPSSTKISDPDLERFGLVQYAAPITTEEFSALSISDRYEFNFNVFGMKPIPIPDKFMGGNPYLN
jgi:hypothetical protein